MTAESNAKALNLFLAATPIGQIKTTMGYRSTTSAMAAITRALKSARSGKNPDTARSIEIERLDSIYRQLALQQDAKAIDQCLKIGEQRLRLMDAPTKAQKGLLKAYEDTVKALDDRLKPEDSALIQSGRMIASQIDYAVTHGTGIEVTKALYLMPHLMNVLRELGATPDARGSIANAIQDAKPKQVSDEFEEYLAKMT